jgi:ABC-type transport system substrate-binding protein
MHRRLIGLLAAGAIVAAACGGTTATPGPGTPAPGETPGAATPTATEAPADQTLTMVMDGDVAGGLTNAADNVPTANVTPFMHNALFIYDASLEPVPDLAAGEAEITEEGRVWTVTLNQGVKFHDGTDLTAEDVVYNYQIGQSENCRWNPSICLATVLESVEAVDDYTVRFTLTAPDATFLTVFMPNIFIESKDALEASYARYLEGTQQLNQADVTGLLDRVAAEEATPTGPNDDEGNPTVNYEQFVADLEGTITGAGQQLPDKTVYTTDGVLDTATYGGELVNRVKAIAETFTGTASDALAAAYPYLDFQLNPVGTGPFKFVTYRTGESIELEAFPDYFNGAPQISRVFIPIIKDDLAGGQALVAGQVDYKYSLEGSTYNQIQTDPNLQFVEYPDFGYFDLQFNLREGRLFADRNLRQALSMCFDKPATVEAATEGQGVAIYSDIPPASWAFPSGNIETFPLNPERGKQLIEESGWTLGSDGIYEKDGQKLATVVAVRAGRPNRSLFMQLLSDQARDNCGIDITYQEVDFGALLNMLNVFPHINAAAPERGLPFDAYFGGWGSAFDPDPYSLYHGDECSTAENPSTFNYICYNNPEINALIERGKATFDIDERAAIYQEYATLKAQDVPTLLGWADIAREGLRRSVSTTEGPFQLDSPTFGWELHKWTNIK